MIIWGGFSFDFGSFNTGGRYNPATNDWIATSTIGAPTARTLHRAIWTGAEMIVWGGYNSGNDLSTGGRLNPMSNTWTPTSTVNAPSARESYSVVWTGSEMIVWGGLGCGSNCRLNTGSRYNPATDTWTATSLINAPSARWNHTAVWTGTEMIVWGGTDQTNYLNTGGRYNPATDTWTPVSLADAPSGRIGHNAIWTGSEMVVWGGVQDGTFSVTNSGGRYNPATDSWVATSTAQGAPAARSTHAAAWTGGEMIIWGGSSTGGDFGNGARYNAGADTWTPMSATNAPLARSYHTAVWTGNEMILWGGASGAQGILLDTGARYRAQPSTPLIQSVGSRKTHGSAGSFDIDLPLSGTPAIDCRSGGATGDYTIVVTFNANVAVSGSPQATVTSGVGAIGRSGAQNGGVVTTSGNVVTIPLTNVANAQAINVTLNNVNGATNVTIPMRVLVGDVNGNGAVNASDISQVKAASGQSVAATNFRADVNANGAITSSDIGQVKAQSGTMLP